MNEIHTTHGLSNTAEFDVWSAMIQRCHNPRNKDYKGYGERGILVDPRWRFSFKNFLADMGRRPERSVRMTIERKNNDGNYCPDNCIWATYKVQANNQRVRSKGIGEQHPNAKLTAEIVKTIRGKYVRRKYDAVMLGKEYGVSSTVVYSILQHKTWRHVA